MYHSAEQLSGYAESYLSISHAATRGFDVQKRQNASRSCTGWILLRAQGTVCYVVLCTETSRWFDCWLLLLRTFKCSMLIHFFPFTLLTLTVIACSMFLVCCKYYLCLLVYRSGEQTCSLADSWAVFVRINDRRFHFEKNFTVTGAICTLSKQNSPIPTVYHVRGLRPLSDTTRKYSDQVHASLQGHGRMAGPGWCSAGMAN